MSLTAKHIKLLKRMESSGRLMVARWDYDNLRDLARAGLVSQVEPITTTGSLSSTVIWHITRAGSAFLKTQAGVR
ncbi:MAG: hypothetical protein KGL44_03825 [Sphingomonadales bacterium]|nr:hypothetical protein [Sphingomonadales bacterium]